MKVLVLPDLHVPYTNMDYIKEAYAFNKKYKADIVVQLGDFFDFYNLSSYAKSTDADSAREELEAARKQVKIIAKMFPKMTILKGNHEDRLNRRANEAGIPPAYVRTAFEVVDAPSGWNYIDKEPYIEIDGVIYTHGFLSNPKQHSEYFNAPCVIGHLHQSMGVTYTARQDSMIYAMCLGFMADMKSMVFQYGALKKYNKFTPGFGYVIDGIPHIHPLLARETMNSKRHNLHTRSVKAIEIKLN